MSVENLKKRNSKCGFFGNDREIPEGRKVVVTDDNIDQWLAAHFNMKLDQVPT